MSLDDQTLFEILGESRRRAIELIDRFTFEERPQLDLAPLRAVITEGMREFDIAEWLKLFRQTLLKILGDVDHLLATLPTTNAKDEIGHDLSTSIKRIAAYQMLDTSVPGSSLAVATNHDRTAEDIVQEMIQMVTKAGFPAHIYQEPVSVTVFSEKGLYVGGIVAFRELEASPISGSTVRLMEALRPVFAQIFIHSIARYRSENAVQISMSRAAQQIITQFALTRSESRVLLLLLFGCSYNEIAADLDVTINTVRKHIKSLHAKTGTSSTVEIYARFIARRHLR